MSRTATFRDTAGLQVMTRDDARQVGTVSGLLVDPDPARIRSVDIGANARQRHVDFGHVNIGDDAVVLDTAESLREAGDDRERRAEDGDLELFGKVVLDDSGDSHGEVEDAVFDADAGTLTELRTTTGSIPADRLRAVGSFAVVIRDDGEA